jgi:hypothetical protein
MSGGGETSRTPLEVCPMSTRTILLSLVLCLPGACAPAPDDDAEPITLAETVDGRAAPAAAVVGNGTAASCTDAIRVGACDLGAVELGGVRQ